MKSLFVLLMTAGFALHLQAQVILTAEDMPEVGDVLHYANDTASISVNLGVPGGPQTWDFSSLGADLEQVISVIPVEQTPLAAQFPDANICLQAEEQLQYGNVSSERYTALGAGLYLFDTENLTPLRFNPSQTLMEFPATWNSSFSTVYGLDLTLSGADFGVDSIRIRQVASKQVVFDSYGELVLPSGTYDAIRAKEYTTTNDSIFIQLFGFWQLVDASTTVDSLYQWYGPAGKGILATINVDQTTGVSVYATFFNGLETQVQAPVAVFSYQITGGSVAFTDASSNEPTEWFWDFGDNTTSTDQNPVHEYGASGTYEVCLTATNEGGNSTACQSIVVIVTSTGEADNSQGIMLFPNPVSERLNINIANESLGKDCRLLIFDATGRLLECHKIADSSWSMSMQDFVAGAYFYQLQNAGGEVVYSGKLIKN